MTLGSKVHLIYYDNALECPCMFSIVLGLGTLCFYLCILFDSLMLSSHGFYAFEVNVLFSNYVSTQTQHNVSFSNVLKHDRNKYNLLEMITADKLRSTLKHLRLGYYSNWSNNFCLLF